MKMTYRERFISTFVAKPFRNEDFRLNFTHITWTQGKMIKQTMIPAMAIAQYLLAQTLFVCVADNLLMIDLNNGCFALKPRQQQN